MSPRIELEIHSIAYDPQALKLYVTMTQIFTIWIIPFHIARVTLTTVLDLTTDPTGQSTSSAIASSSEEHRDHASYADVVANGATDPDRPTNGQGTLYYIAKQEDLYQTSEFIKFLLPHVGQWIVMAMQMFATVFCVLGVFLWWPFVWMEERGGITGMMLRGGNIVYHIERSKGMIGSS
ncbi:hypothetical protein BDV28DRAFT_131973 [Aspergillus coremiiformis]|uniref:SigF-like NTF2-like domain-containing protein n=1 Tax=Aspergillus coremiiformis TaxID=138285 RepID=A0A5N6ZBD9_9EURO|nr:hypothetical protein BDV28DRAFT_131973 [Aspergillus coremiiformis]